MLGALERANWKPDTVMLRKQSEGSARSDVLSDRMYSPMTWWEVVWAVADAMAWTKRKISEISEELDGSMFVPVVVRVWRLVGAWWDRGIWCGNGV